MVSKISQIKKRDGSVVSFDSSKIANAIFKAARSVGGQNREEADRLVVQVIKELEEQTEGIPTVEQVQDLVEKVLIEAGHAKTAKSYIVYRQKRAEAREEKMRVLEKDYLDEVDKRFDVNALRVLKARYLKKDEKGKLTETPKQLFTRISTHLGVPEIFYDEKVFDINERQNVFEIEEFEKEKHDNKLSIGGYKLNQYHMEGMRRLYERYNKQKKMKVSWSQFLELLEQGYFNKYERNIDEFYNLMVEKKFMPNTPAIANFGNSLGMGSACFVLGVEDSMESIMDTLKHTAIIHKSGGGTGFNFSKIRPEGDFVSSTSGAASGPLSFMRMFDTMTEVVKQGGIRRGANMGILNSNHPDIEKFITAKAGNKALTNFNISVLLMPDFWECYEKNKPYPLLNPRNNEVVKTVDPRALFDKIVFQAWESAEPGVIFFDIVNDYNPFFEHLGPIVTTNPCGEVLLYPDEPCNLGSINVWAFAKEDEQGNVYYDWNSLKEVTKKCTKLLDNVIDVNKFPLKQIEEMSLNTRKIGLGVMGVGDLLYELRLPYNSEEGRKFMEKLMQFIAYHSHVESMELARKRGNLPYYDKSFYQEGRLPFRGFELKDEWEHDWKKLSDDIKKYGTRNGYTTVIAPTGSISMIAGCSSGMEPVYSLAFEKNVKVGSFYYVDPAFERALRREGLYSEEHMQEICENGGSVQGLEDFPAKLQKAFVTAMDINPEDHIRALAAFQKWVDSSISKTNNFPADATVEHMRDSYILAYRLGCKDVTVFRDSSIKNQVLVAPKKKEIVKKAAVIEAAEIKHELGAAGNGSAMAQKELDSGRLVMQSESKTRTCPECGGQAQIQEGCVSCKACGWALCK
ncbi:adenosylcobalamin-dependent ribonucleoside-diphosphate reductase [Candidatus Woesearchaeota archaeon]|nr:adenosylcobalamin-dependent ribonucleoside-diphosphate reductase [Candidatus Woesearchaeota archaeon]